MSAESLSPSMAAFQDVLAFIEEVRAAAPFVRRENSVYARLDTIADKLRACDALEAKVKRQHEAHAALIRAAGYLVEQAVHAARWVPHTLLLDAIERTKDALTGVTRS